MGSPNLKSWGIEATEGRDHSQCEDSLPFVETSEETRSRQETDILKWKYLACLIKQIT